jgi:hypothetical protein
MKKNKMKKLDTTLDFLDNDLFDYAELESTRTKKVEKLKYEYPTININTKGYIA